MPSTDSVRPQHEAELLQSVFTGIAYLLAVQLAFLIMPFTSETLWLWAFGAAEAVSNGHLIAFLTSGEWWLALAFPIGIFGLGAVAAYAYLGYENPWPAVIAGGFLGLFYLTEVVLMGQFEYAILYVAVTPIVTIIALVGHVFAPHRRTPTPG